MDKKAFIKTVRNWQSETVAYAVTGDPALARYADKIGKTGLHHCAEINPRKFRLKVSDSIATAKVLLDAGTDVNAARIIIDEGEEFLATPLWYAVAWGKNLAWRDYFSRPARTRTTMPWEQRSGARTW